MKLPEPIPFVDFGGHGPTIHFAHANGYPPQAYHALMEQLSGEYSIVAMRMRPLWRDSDPSTFQNWELLTSDLADFLDQHNLKSILGVGHSMGAVATLRLALREPDRFKAIVLIDPVLFPPWMILLWEYLYKIGVSYYIHPLIRGALRRKQRFPDRQSMFDNYRLKRVFRYLDDPALWAYVDSMAFQEANGEITLVYPSRWEVQVYITGIRSDRDIWQCISSLKPPALIIRGKETDTFWEMTSRRLRRKNPTIEIRTIPQSTHLVALERPHEVHDEIIKFFNRHASTRSEN